MSSYTTILLALAASDALLAGCSSGRVASASHEDYVPSMQILSITTSL